MCSFIMYDRPLAAGTQSTILIAPRPLLSLGDDVQLL